MIDRVRAGVQMCREGQVTVSEGRKAGLNGGFRGGSKRAQRQFMFYKKHELGWFESVSSGENYTGSD